MEPNYTNVGTLIASIAQTNREIIAVDQSIDNIEGKLTAETNRIETAVAFNTSLKNDTQRKLARHEFQEGSVIFKQWSEDLAYQRLEKQDLRNRLEESRALLSAMQMEIRRGIVAQETANIERIELR